MILTNKPHKFASSGVFALNVSDHCPIYCIRNSRHKKIPPRMITKRDYKHFDEQAFLYDLQNSDLLDICLTPDPEVALNQFTKIFNHLAN